MSKDQNLTFKRIVENVEIVENLLCSYKVFLENNSATNTETKETKKLKDMFPFNVEYNVLKHLLKDSVLD